MLSVAHTLHTTLAAICAAAALLLVEAWAPENRSQAAFADAEAPIAGLGGLGDGGRSACAELAAISLLWALWRFGGIGALVRRKSAERKLAGSASRQPQSTAPEVAARRTGAMRTALRSAVLAGDLSEAALLFRKMQPCVDCDFGLIVGACIDHGDMPLARQLFEEVAARSGAPSRAVFHTMMRACTKLQDIVGVRRIFSRMQDAGHEPDRAAYTCLMSCALQVGECDEVFAWYDELLARDVRIDAGVVSIMLHASCHATDPQAGRKALSILEVPGVDVCCSIRLLHAVLNACVRWMDFKHLDLALREFHRREPSLPCRRYTYFLAIRGNAALGRTDAAQALWKSMLRRNVEPTAVLVACMINTLVIGGCVEEALQIFRAWQGKVCYDHVVYTVLIKGFANERDANRAVALFEDMKLAGVKANCVAYATVIAACTHERTMSRAQALFREMLESGCKPNVAVYTSLISGHCRVGDMRGALELLRLMHASGLAVDAVVYNALLNGCVNYERWDLGLDVLRQMDDHGIRRTSFTVSILVKMWSRRKQLEKAIEVARAGLASGEAILCGRAGQCRPGSVDPRLASCLIGACIHNRAPRRALELFAEIKAWPGLDGPDAHTYSALILGLAKEGLIEKAVEITEEACATFRSEYTKSVISEPALNALLIALIDSGTAEQIGWPLSVKLREAGMPRFGSWLRHTLHEERSKTTQSDRLEVCEFADA